MRRLYARLMVLLLVPAVAGAYNLRQSFIDTPDACYQTERQEGENVYLKAVGICNGKPGRAVIHSDFNRLKVIVDGKPWKDVTPQPLGLPEVEATLDKASRISDSMTVPSNKADAEMKVMAGKMDNYYRSHEFQGRLKAETLRITNEIFGETTTRFYPDSRPPAIRGKLGSDERIYIFISSAMPLQTIRNYTASVARLSDPNITFVMRGFVEGMTKIQPTIRFIGSVLQRDSSCNPAEEKCEMLPAGLAVDPLLFRRYGIDRVPAVTYVRGLKSEDAGLSEGDRKNSSISEGHTAFGDASLEFLIEQIQRETGSLSLTNLLTASSRKN